MTNSSVINDLWLSLVFDQVKPRSSISLSHQSPVTNHNLNITSEPLFLPSHHRPSHLTVNHCFNNHNHNHNLHVNSNDLLWPTYRPQSLSNIWTSFVTNSPPTLSISYLTVFCNSVTHYSFTFYRSLHYLLLPTYRPLSPSFIAPSFVTNSPPAISILLGPIPPPFWRRIPCSDSPSESSLCMEMAPAWFSSIPHPHSHSPTPSLLLARTLTPSRPPPSG